MRDGQARGIQGGQQAGAKDLGQGELIEQVLARFLLPLSARLVDTAARHDEMDALQIRIVPYPRVHCDRGIEGLKSRKTPIKEILQLMRKEKWMFPADIELEYKIPEDSNAVAEVAKCVRFCKEALA